MLAFVLAAVALLGSPGPGIAALLAVGRAHGLRKGLPFYSGLQAGLMLAVLLCATGVFSLLAAAPGATTAMLLAGTLYLLFLAWRIATSPVSGQATATAPPAPTIAGGFVLGALNPKAYLAVIALLSAQQILPEPDLDILAKSALCIVVIILVDIAWLGVGAALGLVSLSPRGERVMNGLMGATLAVAAVAGLA